VGVSYPLTVGPNHARRLPTESWSNAAGWTVWIPVGWERDPDSLDEAFVPPSGLGRLSIHTQRARQAVEISEAFARQQATRLLPDAGLLGRWRSPPDDVEELGVNHLAVVRTGRNRGRQHYSVVHVFPPGLIVYARWHTSERDDPDWDDGVAAARSIAPGDIPAR
jgi:hypothetical protein